MNKCESQEMFMGLESVRIRAIALVRVYSDWKVPVTTLIGGSQESHNVKCQPLKLAWVTEDRITTKTWKFQKQLKSCQEDFIREIFRTGKCQNDLNGNFKICYVFNTKHVRIVMCQN